MKVEESPFVTAHLGTPISRGVLEHNAYVVGWEHGAADHRPGSTYWQTMRELGLLETYTKGRENGTKARSAAWEKATRGRDGSTAANIKGTDS